MKAIILVVLSGCATLGPMPATTGMRAVPAERTDAELQAGVMPGYYLSQSTTENPRGDGIGQVSLAVEPGKVVPGLVAGFRIFGPDDDTRGEPMLGYRRAFGEDRRVAIGGVVYGTAGGAEKDLAKYHMARGGAEVLVDVRGFGESRYAEPHFLASASLTAVSANGTYCQDTTSTYGSDCMGEPDNMTSAELSGAYPAATAGVALDFARHLKNPFHGARLMALFAVGQMPHVVAGQQTSSVGYATIGLALSLSAGAR